MNFTAHKFEIVELLISGVSTCSIIEKLAITRSTLKSHLRNIYHKTGVSNRMTFTAAVMKDISTKEVLEEGTKRLQAFIQQSRDGIIIIDAHGIIVE